MHKKAVAPRDDIAFPRLFNREMVNLLKDVESLNSEHCIMSMFTANLRTTALERQTLIPSMT